MSDQKETNDGQSPTNLNTIPDDATQDDLEFNRWRRFCSENKLDINLLVSQLSSEQDKKWNEFKRQDEAREEATQ